MHHNPITFTYRNRSPGTIPPSVLMYREELREVAAMKGEYLTHEHHIRLPDDPHIISDVVECAKRYWNTQLKYVIVIGIGGSNLGTEAVYNALFSERKNDPHAYPKLIFLDSVSQSELEGTLDVLRREVRYPEEVVVNLISKSGTTTESVANFEWLMSKLLVFMPNVRDRVVLTTDHNSPLWKMGERSSFGLLPIPKLVGGRFSVFSTVGLFPLALLGVDITEFRRGGKDIFHEALFGDDSPLRAAELVMRTMREGVRIINFFFFNKELESAGKWCRQLYAESLGKEKDRGGRTVHAGLTPIVSLGSVDLHSMAQLYLGGPADKFTIFLRIPNKSRNVLPKEGMLEGLVPNIYGKSPDAILQAIYDGTKRAYDANKLPYGELEMPALSPYGMGAFFAWHMLVVMYLGVLLNVNTFDQPNVEEYKRATRDNLKNG